MSANTKKIADALGARERQEAVQDLDQWSGTWFSSTDLASTAELAASKLARFQTLADEIDVRVKMHVESFIHNVRDVPPDVRKGLVERTRVKIRRELVAISEAERIEALKAMTDVEAKLSRAQEGYWKSPSHIASRYGIMTEARERASRAVASAGTATLEHLARLVASAPPELKDRQFLAAALVERISNLPKDQRPNVSAMAVARAAFGEEFDRVSSQIAFAKAKIAELRSLNRAIEGAARLDGSTGSGDNLGKLRAGLDRAMWTGALNDDGSLREAGEASQ